MLLTVGVHLGEEQSLLLGAEPVTADSIKQSVELARATMQVVEPPSKAADNEGSDGDFFD